MFSSGSNKNWWNLTTFIKQTPKMWGFLSLFKWLDCEKNHHNRRTLCFQSILDSRHFVKSIFGSSGWSHYTGEVRTTQIFQWTKTRCPFVPVILEFFIIKCLVPYHYTSEMENGQQCFWLEALTQEQFWDFHLFFLSQLKLSFAHSWIPFHIIHWVCIGLRKYEKPHLLHQTETFNI